MRAKREMSLDIRDAELLPLVEVFGHVAVEEEQEEREQQQDLHQHPAGMYYEGELLAGRRSGRNWSAASGPPPDCVITSSSTCVHSTAAHTLYGHAGAGSCLPQLYSLAAARSYEYVQYRHMYLQYSIAQYWAMMTEDSAH